MSDQIEGYLAQLRAGLQAGSARTGEIVDEAEDHLRESAAARRAAGLAEDAAQRAAIEAFGPVTRVIRAHRPPASAYALAAGLRALPLLACYLVFSAVIGVAVLLTERNTAHDQVMTVAVVGPDGHVVNQFVPRPDFGAQAALITGCVLAGVLLTAGFLAVRGQYERAGRGLVRLPRGLFSLAAALGLLAVALAGLPVASSYWADDRVAPYGTYALLIGGDPAALLLGLGCLMGAFSALTGTRRQEAAPGQARAANYAVAAGLRAGQLLGGYLLLTALLGGIVSYARESGEPGWFSPWPGALLLAGCFLTGAVLIAVRRVAERQCLRSGLRPARLPRGARRALSAAGLLALAVAEYLFFCGDVMGRLHVSDGISDVILASQYAVVLAGASWALRGVASLTRQGMRATSTSAPAAN